MSAPQVWRDAFPAKSARAVVAYLLETWQVTAARKLPAFNWVVSEPHLTQTLKDVLRHGSRAAGLSGEWGSENATVQRNWSTLEKIKGFRTDITYYSDREHPKILSLTFEWKKLNGKKQSSDAYWGASGMGRFLELDGYAADAPFGLMVGVYESAKHQAHVAAVQSAMATSAAAALLNYLPVTGGASLTSPSVEMPGLAAFDTQHIRTSGGFTTFTFSHLFVCFP